MRKFINLNKKIVFMMLGLLSTTNVSYAGKEPSYEYKLSYQKDMLASAGADNIISAYRIFEFADNKISNRVNIENETLATIARSLKVLLIDYPLASWAMIAQHEYFGHGGRLRDMNVSGISYEINPFSGVTYWRNTAAYSASPLPKRIAVSAGGMESTTLLATTLHKDWFSKGYINAQDGVLGFVSSFDAIHYIASTSSSSFANDQGHDVNGYITEINQWHGSNTITAKSLRKKNVVNLLNPFLWFGVMSVGNYIDNGERVWQFPSISIGSAQYLPAMCMYLAPWGPEYHLNNFIKDSYGRDYILTVRYGKTGAKKGQGIGINVNGLYKNKMLSINAEAKVWRQPNLEASSAAIAKDKTGWLASVGVYYAITRDFHAGINAGYKRKGFVPGESTSSGTMVKASLFLRV